jgi:hypothetical protein
MFDNIALLDHCWRPTPDDLGSLGEDQDDEEDLQDKDRNHQFSEAIDLSL